MPFPWALWLCRSAQTTAAVLMAGTAALRLLTHGTSLHEQARQGRLNSIIWSVLFLAATLQLGLTAADMSGLPLAQACAGPVLGSVLTGTTFGTVWIVRMGLLAAAFLVGWRIGARESSGGQRQASARLEIAAVLLSGALLATLMWSGHARASDKHAWLLPVDLLHVIAAGAWPGGLLPLARLLTRARQEPNLVSPALTVTRRFSRLSVVAVGTLALSGLLNSVGLVGTLAALWPSVYGRLILGKAALFVAMLGLGAANRRLIRQDETASAPQILRALWRNVAWESAFAAGVLLATEALAMNAPPAEM